MGLILIRYGELALKSRSVRARFERLLVRNIETAMMHNRLEGLIRREYGRLYLETSEPERGIALLRKIFGLTSVSSVVECDADLATIAKTVIAYLKPIFANSHFRTYALRVHRTGTHEFTSLDAAKYIGAEVDRKFQDRKIRVDLNAPDVPVFIEIRNKRAYIFGEKLECVGGLPLGTQGNVVAVVCKEDDLIAAWLMMKRGCETALIIPEKQQALAELLKNWCIKVRVRLTQHETLEELILYASENAASFWAEALVLGLRLEQIAMLNELREKISLPIFCPLIGLNDEMIDSYRKIVFQNAAKPNMK